jgi:DnaJ homolog subfamily C member 25
VCRVKESVNTTAIIAAYRKLAREWHPDKNSHRREEAERTFSQIAHAYDILKSDVSRKDYDYALKHPEQFAYNQYRYYYGRYYVRHVQVCTHLSSCHEHCALQF